MLNRDEDILKAAEDWQKAGHGVALANRGRNLGLGAATRRLEPCHQRRRDVPGVGVRRLRRGGGLSPRRSTFIASGQPKMLEFGVADETAWNVGLSCGGTIRVFVEKVGQS